MQLSSNHADCIVDVLALTYSIGPCLGPTFADSKARNRYLPACAQLRWSAHIPGSEMGHVNLQERGSSLLAWPVVGK